MQEMSRFLCFDKSLGNTPLHTAKTKQIVFALIDAGADVHSRNMYFNN